MQLELLAGRGDLEQRVVQLLERRLGPEQPQPGAHSRHVRVDGHVAHPQREQQHAGGGLATDPRQRRQTTLSIGDGKLREPVQRELTSRRRVTDPAQDRLDPRGLDLRDAAGPDRLLNLIHRRVADRLPVGEAFAEPQVGDVAIAVVGRLRQHGQDQLGDWMAVRLGLGNPVHQPQPAANRAHAPRRGLAPPAGWRLDLRRAHWQGRYPRPGLSVDEHTIELAGSPAFYRTAPAPGAPALYVHGVPTSSDDWISFLERSGGIAPDLIGFGRSAKGGNLDYSIEGLTDFLERLLEHLQIDRVKLVVHDWGAAVGLAFAQRNPARIERIVVI